VGWPIELVEAGLRPSIMDQGHLYILQAADFVVTTTSDISTEVLLRLREMRSYPNLINRLAGVYPDFELRSSTWFALNCKDPQKV